MNNSDHRTEDYSALRMSLLRDPEVASAYLNEAFEQGGPDEIASAVRHVMEANNDQAGALETKYISEVLRRISAYGLSLSFHPSTAR